MGFDGAQPDIQKLQPRYKHPGHLIRRRYGDVYSHLIFSAAKLRIIHLTTVIPRSDCRKQADSGNPFE